MALADPKTLVASAFLIVLKAEQARSCRLAIRHWSRAIWLSTDLGGPALFHSPNTQNAPPIGILVGLALLRSCEGLRNLLKVLAVSTAYGDFRKHIGGCIRLCP
jgi:hypothetical protein